MESKSPSSSSLDPVHFINWQMIQTIFDQTKQQHIRQVILLHLDGSLLCTSSTPSSDADYNDTTTSSSSSTSTSPSSPSNTVSPKIIGALLANIWKQYEHLWRDQEFKEMIVDCENGILCVTRLAQFLLIFYADSNIELGLLKHKMTSLATHLEPLTHVYES